MRLRSKPLNERNRLISTVVRRQAIFLLGSDRKLIMVPCAE